ncbi:hypothetical protein Prum_002030 [Phytohabitans rumicis]|uniref:HTH cro/C1-type domain-containing protein n=1 Tax=Phytohabitans rumicis TaxID=1076125 RepID=A0A6V8KVZ0_9ACTN|nr:hypothetical protein Prum_002030 [Phytohabitans rumicis]
MQRLAAELRQLRESAGKPTYRELAKRCGYSVTALADAAGGRRLPALPVLRGYVQACGADPAPWEERWRATSLELAQVRADRSADIPPYVGLSSYQQADSALFFGRERLVGELAERLKGGGFLAVVGPSGSGKSSLLRAGLLPALVDNPETALGAADSLVLTPGSHPFTTYAAALNRPAPPLRLIVVDQFEELFTLCGDESERTRFVDALLDIAAEPDVRVAVGLRADFYGHCAGHSRLAQALQDATALVGPMDEEELRRAVTGPAALVGLSVERALVTKVIGDAAGQSGALPMVSHALLQTWRHRQGETLTLAAYEAAGGLTGAIARTAEAVYESLTEPQRRAARQILTRLTALGDGTADTRRRVDRSELTFAGADTVLERLAHARLLVIDGTAVEIAHEALIGAWPRLRDWLTEDREALRVHRDLTGAAASWHALDRDPGALHRGARLAIAREWVAGAGRAGELNPVETAFLAASVAAEADERAAATRRAQQLRRLSSGLAGLLALALVTSLVAVWQWRSAVRQRQEATSRQLAMQALSLAETDASEAARLSLRAYDEAPTVEARGALLSLAGSPAYTARLAHASVLTAVAFSADGTLLAAAENTGPVTVWDLARRTRRAQLTGYGESVRSLAFTPSGHLVTGGRGGAVLVWDVERGHLVTRLRGLHGIVDSVAVSPDGAIVAAVGAERRILLWRATGGDPVGELGGSGGLRSDVAFSPDGRLLASAGDDGAAVLWDVATRTRVRSLRPGSQPLHAVAFSPDGGTLAVGGVSRDITTFAVASGKQLRVLRGHTATVRSLAFTPAGTLVSSANDRWPRLWDVRKGRMMSRRDGSTSEVYAIAVSPDGRLLAGAGQDRAVLLWDTAAMPLTGHSEPVHDVAVAPGAGTVASAGNDGRVILWDPRSHTALSVLSPGAAVTGLAYRPDGRQLASAHPDGARIWDVATGRPVRTLGGAGDRLLSIAFAPDGKLLATGSGGVVGGSMGGAVRLFDAERGTQIAELSHPTQVERVAFAAGGAVLVSASLDGTVTVWDVARRTVRAVLRDQPLLTVATTKDASLIAIGRADGTVALWTVGTPRPDVILRGHSGPVESIAFSPDERLLATGSSDREIRLWSGPRRTLYAVLDGYGGKVTALAFSADGRVLYAGGSDHTVTPWPVDPADAHRQTCDHLLRDFSRPVGPPCPAS